MEDRRFPHVAVAVSEESVDPRYDAVELSDLTALTRFEPSLVQQQFKEEVDINTIMRRFNATGSFPEWRREGIYGDFSGIYDYEDAEAKVAEVDRRFMGLPAELRERFENNPQKLMEAVQSLSAEEFGALVAPPVVEVVAPVEEPAP